MLRFHDLEQKFGGVVAYHYLLELEKAANINSWEMVAVDFETRTANACRMQDMSAGQAA